MMILNKTLSFVTVLNSSHHGHGGISEFLSEHLGKFGEFLEEVFLHAILDTLPLIPFLFLTYLLMEFIEHGAADKTISFLKKSDKIGPLIGGAVGIIPQCGFSSVASNLYCTKIITMGTVISVFLATSDEMLPLLISNPDISVGKILFILAYKFLIAVLVGFSVDFAMKLMNHKKEEINIDELCDNDNCHCEKGILHSAIHHTVKILIFIFLATVVINTAVFLIGSENLSKIMYNKPVISHVIAAFFGLIPNCAASVALTEFYTSGFITIGTMLSGLFSGSGVGLLVLFKVNKNVKNNLVILGILVLVGTLCGLGADLLNFEALF